MEGMYQLRSPVHKVLSLLLIPDRIGGPDHSGRFVLDCYEALVRPGYQVCTLPDEDPP
jgi:hypothetical protein